MCSEAFQDMVANITGTDGDGPIRVFIHKVGTRLVLLPKLSRIVFDVDRCIPGPKFKMLTRKWQRTRTGKFTYSDNSSAI